ncbi:MAG: MFS transporter [Candidatus Baltobacteraceae bacterium]
MAGSASSSEFPVADRKAWNLRGLSVIAFAHGLSDFYSGIVPFAIFYVVTRAGLSPAYQGALGFLWYLTSSVVQPFFGAYTDRHGRWWFLPSAVGITAIAVSLCGVATGLAALATCIIVGGIGSAIMHPEAGKYSAMLSGTRRASGISIFQLGGQIGYAIGPALVAILLARFGGIGTLVLLPPGALLVAILFATMRGVDREAARDHGEATTNAPVKPGGRDRVGVGLLVASTGLRYFVTAAFMTYLPNALVGRGASLAAAGQIVSAFLLVSGIGLLAGGYLADRFGAIRVSVASLCAAVPCLLVFSLLPGSPGIAFLLLGSVLLAIQNAPGVALVQAMLPKNLGMALGLMNGVAFGAGSAFVAVLGFAVARYGAAPTLTEVAWVPLIAALPFALVGLRARLRSRPVNVIGA